MADLKIYKSKTNSKNIEKIRSLFKDEVYQNCLQIRQFLRGYLSGCEDLKLDNEKEIIRDKLYEALDILSNIDIDDLKEIETALKFISEKFSKYSSTVEQINQILSYINLIKHL